MSLPRFTSFHWVVTRPQHELSPCLNLFLKNLTVLPEPVTRSVHGGYLCLHYVPESRRMVGLQKVGEFMGDNVID